jgi:SSS family solute:Na+ symporter
MGKTNVIISSCVLLVAFLAIVVVEMILSGKLVALVTGLPYALSVFIAALIVFIYVFTGGFKSDVRTDFFQYLMIFLLIIIAMAILPGASIATADLDFFAAGPVVIISFLVLGIFSMFMSADVWQRAFAARDRKTLKRGFWGAAFSFLIIGAITTVIGLVFKAQFPAIDPNNALLHGFSQLPEGIVGIGLVALLSTTMSTIDTSLFISSLFVARDIASQYGKQSALQLKALVRKTLIILTIIAAGVALAIDNLVYIMYNVFNFALIVSPAVLGSFFWNMKRRAICASLVAGTLAALALVLMNQVTAETTTIPFFISAIVLIIAQLVLPREKI